MAKPSTARKSASPKPFRTRPAPSYRGRRWVPVRLPDTQVDWAQGGEKSIYTDDPNSRRLVALLDALNREKAWVFPKRRQYFLSDLHGDPEAFSASLVASGGVKRTGPGADDFELTRAGKEANFIIGGDCFDKGPSSLGLLRAIRTLIKKGARVRILAGNHDIRVLLGMRAVGKKKEVRNEHFFIRTGQKILPLLKEINDAYLSNKGALRAIPTAKICRKRLFPNDSWFDDFANLSETDILPAQRDREIKRVRKKLERFEATAADMGLNLRQVYAAAIKWQELFLNPEGEFYWFYKSMRLCYQSGSFLYVHAGLDDEMARAIRKDGIGEVNRTFRRAMKEAPADFYYGSLCNTIRTKYRKVDRPLTADGAKQVRKAGITALIHGHRNLHNGQRLALRASLLNFECDTSLDRHTRKLEKVRGRGASVTIIDPGGFILGISSDYPHIKVFDPAITPSHIGSAKAPKPRRYSHASRRPHPQRKSTAPKSPKGRRIKGHLKR